MTPESEAFFAAPQQFADVGTAELAYRKFGSGPPLLCIHGWPLRGSTFRRIVPALSKHFTVFVTDSPGLGETRWRDDHDFAFVSQVKAYVRFVEKVGLGPFKLLGQDTGATIGRQLALELGRGQVEKLAMLNTEIPNHRPPFITLFQKVTALPGSALSFQLLLRSKLFQESSMGFGGCFDDLKLLEGDFQEQMVAPLIADRRRMQGVIHYLRGIDWQMVDAFKTRHAELRVPLLMVWGADDPTFPVPRAEEMVGQFPDCRGLKTIPKAKLLVHEERPEEVVNHLLPFFLG